MIGCKPCATPIDPNKKVHEDDGNRLISVGRCQRLVKRLIYLPITRPNINYVVDIISQFMHAPTTVHLETVYQVLRYLKWYLIWQSLKIEAYIDVDWVGSISNRRSTSGYSTFVGGNLITWRSKKQPIVP